MEALSIQFGHPSPCFEDALKAASARPYVQESWRENKKPRQRVSLPAEKERFPRSSRKSRTLQVYAKEVTSSDGIDRLLPRFGGIATVSN
jgi:hypothetical protein